MSCFHGRQGSGALRAHRAVLRAEAEDRATRTPEHQRKAFLYGPVPDGGRTERSVRSYRTAFLAENGNTPENVREIADRLTSS